MRDDVDPGELQWVVQAAIAFAFPLLGTGTGLDMGDWRIVGERESHEAPAVEVESAVVAPVAAVVATAGGAKAFAFGVFDLPHDPTPTVIAFHPHADAVWSPWEDRGLLQFQRGVFCHDGGQHTCFLQRYFEACALFGIAV